MPDRYEEPPTLPLPPTWRIVVALCVTVGFLYWIYRSYPEEQAPPPASSGQQSLQQPLRHLTAPVPGIV
jgi:hypothetical protein